MPKELEGFAKEAQAPPKSLKNKRATTAPGERPSSIMPPLRRRQPLSNPPHASRYSAALLQIPNNQITIINPTTLEGAPDGRPSTGRANDNALPNNNHGNH